MKHLVGILRDWAQAISGWRDNPLCRYWQLAEARRSAARPWWQRTPGLAISGIVISAGITVGEILVILDYHRLGQSINIVSRLHVIHHGSLATAILVGGIIVFALIWLMSRFHAAVVLSLGFLETDPRQVLRTVLDDLVATSHLTAQEILIGLLAYSLRLVAPPLGLLSLAALAASSLRLQWLLPTMGTFSHYNPAVEDISEIVLFLVASGFTVLSTGCLATLIICSICIAVSLNRQSALAPGIGAASLVVMQILLIGGAGYSRATHSYGVGGSEFAIGNLAILVLLVGLLLYLARRMLWLRRALAYGFPLLILFPLQLFFAAFVFSGLNFGNFNGLFCSFIWGMQSLGAAAPLPLLGTVAGESSEFNGWQGNLILVTAQLVLLIAMGEFARDAIRRRKWGGESERV